MWQDTNSSVLQKPIKEMIVGYTAAGKSLTLRDYGERLTQSEEQVAQGKITSQEGIE